MNVALVCMSHSPLLDHADLPDNVAVEVDYAFSRARDFVAEFDPTLVVSFAPDHYNGFFYELMPPFCVGYRAEGIGDYGSQTGPLNVPEAVAHSLARHVLGKDIDMAISRRMKVDHGAVQPLEVLFGGARARRVIPIFVNGVAEPFTSMRRIRQMGAAVGDFVQGLREERVLLIGSGGLSHDPPIPQWDTATSAQRDRLLEAGAPSAAARAERERRVIVAAQDFVAGKSPIMELNPDWDQEFMELLGSGDLEAADSYEPTNMALQGGNSAHEVRTWLAAFSALDANGPYTITSSYYRPIKEFIAGFGVMTAARSNGRDGNVASFEE